MSSAPTKYQRPQTGSVELWNTAAVNRQRLLDTLRKGVMEWKHNEPEAKQLFKRLAGPSWTGPGESRPTFVPPHIRKWANAARGQLPSEFGTSTEPLYVDENETVFCYQSGLAATLLIIDRSSGIFSGLRNEGFGKVGVIAPNTSKVTDLSVIPRLLSMYRRFGEALEDPRATQPTGLKDVFLHLAEEDSKRILENSFHPTETADAPNPVVG